LIEERAHALAVEQSVEMPLSAIDNQTVLSEIAGQVAGIEDCGDGWFDVRINLAAETVGSDPGQLLNMLFGNTSLQDDVILVDAEFPRELIVAFGGPAQGIEGLRRRVKAEGRALTSSALKPQGLAPFELGALAYELALGGLDFVKDDHGLADQHYSRFADRVSACASATRGAVRASGHSTRYVPSLSGSYEALERQVWIAGEEGLDTVLIAPMVVGVSNFHALRCAHPDLAFLAHPALCGARISPVLYAKLFRLLGADASIFPNYGGRFGYSATTCKCIAKALLSPWGGLRSSVPVPAGGMSLQRVPEMLDTYGRDLMLLIGGGLLAAPRGAIAREAAGFVRAVAGHAYGDINAGSH
jgi:ribulose-bisphosphate carboxylase large chain